MPHFKYGHYVLFAVVACGLGYLTYDWHVRIFYPEAQIAFQIPRHISVMQGSAGNPWQYRVFSEYLLEGVINLYENLNWTQPAASLEAFHVIKLSQHIFMFWLAMVYYTRLGISVRGALLGAAILTWGMAYAFLDSDLQFNTFFDLIFYLLAALAILQKQMWTIIPITFVAAWNRETSGLIPLLLLAQSVQLYPQFAVNKRWLVIGLAALVLYGLVFFLLREVIYHPQTMILPHGRHPGRDLFNFNMDSPATWERLFATLNILPFLTLLGYRFAPPALQRFAWVILPIWFPIHAFSSVMAETRLFLVPMTIVLIPCALCGLGSSSKPEITPS